MGLSRKQKPNLHMNSYWKSRGDHFYVSALCRPPGGPRPSLGNLEDDDTYQTEMFTSANKDTEYWR